MGTRAVILPPALLYRVARYVPNHDRSDPSSARAAWTRHVDRIGDSRYLHPVVRSLSPRRARRRTPLPKPREDGRVACIATAPAFFERELLFRGNCRERLRDCPHLTRSPAPQGGAGSLRRLGGVPDLSVRSRYVHWRRKARPSHHSGTTSSPAGGIRDTLVPTRRVRAIVLFPRVLVAVSPRTRHSVLGQRLAAPGLVRRPLSTVWRIPDC